MRKLLIVLLLGTVWWIPITAQEIDDVVKVDVGLVTVNLSVKDEKGRPLTGFSAKDFFVTDEGRSVALEFFDSEAPASIVFVVDLSSSMKGPKWNRLRAALKRFLADARNGNDYSLIVFSDQAKLVAQSVSANQVWQSLNALQPGGNTALYDALLLGLKTLDHIPRRHQALVLLSDGQDSSSRALLSDVENEALLHRATIYSVGILYSKDCATPSEDCTGKMLLDRLTVATGGLVDFPELENIESSLQKIGTDLSYQYSLGYYPPDKAPGSRRVRVALAKDGPRLNLRYQRSYVIR